MCVTKYAKIGLPIRKDELKFYGTTRFGGFVPI